MANKLSEINGLLLSMNEDELRMLNRTVVERLNLFQKVSATARMADFNLGDRVMFGNNGVRKIGIVIKLNQKTISVKLTDGHIWLVSPHFLSKIVDT